MMGDCWFRFYRITSPNVIKQDVLAKKRALDLICESLAQCNTISCQSFSTC